MLDNGCLVRLVICHFSSTSLISKLSVPVSRLPELVYETKKDLKNSNLHSTIVGHVGDGNFHALILFDIDRELDAASGAVHRLVHRAIALDGTCQLFSVAFTEKTFSLPVIYRYRRAWCWTRKERISPR